MALGVDERIAPEVPDSGPTAAPVDRPGLTHEPALDGLRGLAVAAVLAFHLDRLGGGFLGVDLFFVLSGFLITGLLVTEHRATETIALGRFWIRRARRLLPALLLALVGVSLLLLVFNSSADRYRFRGDAFATLGYVANWHSMRAGGGYWDLFSQPSPLDHTWSLAIEEQFYLVWPLLAFLLLRRPGRGRETALRVLAIGAAALSFLLLAVTYSATDTNRAYYGTDTRIGATLLGAALATFLVGRPRRERPPSPAVELAAVAGLAWMVWAVVTVDGTSSWYYRGGLAVFAVAALVVVWAVTGGPLGRVGSVVAWRPLRALGAISYGVYLWHWPVFIYLTPARAHVDGVALDALRLAVTLAVSVLSYRLLELPIRRGVIKGRPLRLAAVAGVAATLVVVAVGTAGKPKATAWAGGVPTEGSDDPLLLYPEEIPTRALRVLMVGDSGVEALGPEIVPAAEAAGMSMATSAQLECTVVIPDGDVRDPTKGFVVERHGPCHDERRALWADMVAQFQPDVVVYYLARAGGILDVWLDGDWVFDCDPSYDAYIEGAIHQDLDVLQSGGARVVVTTSPYMGVAERESGVRTDCRNATYREIAAARSDVTVVELGDWVLERVRADGFATYYKDSVHFSPAGGRLVSAWLLPQVEEIGTGLTAAAPPPG